MPTITWNITRGNGWAVTPTGNFANQAAMDAWETVLTNVLNLYSQVLAPQADCTIAPTLQFLPRAPGDLAGTLTGDHNYGSYAALKSAVQAIQSLDVVKSTAYSQLPSSDPSPDATSWTISRSAYVLLNGGSTGQIDWITTFGSTAAWDLTALTYGVTPSGGFSPFLNALHEFSHGLGRSTGSGYSIIDYYVWLSAGTRTFVRNSGAPYVSWDEGVTDIGNLVTSGNNIDWTGSGSGQAATATSAFLSISNPNTPYFMRPQDWQTLLICALPFSPMGLRAAGVANTGLSMQLRR
jgi:hypothetical protein